MKNSTQLPTNIIQKVILGLICGFVVILGLLLFIDFQKVMHAIVEMPLHLLISAFVLTFLSYLLRLWKWHAFTTWSRFAVTLKDNAVIFFVGLMMSITPGKVGELIKAHFLHLHADVPYSKAMPLVIYDRLTDVIAMLVLVGCGLLVYPVGLPVVIVGAIGLLALFVLLQRKTWIYRVIDRLTGRKKLSRFRQPLYHFYEQTMSLMRGRLLGFSFVLSLLSWFLECVSLYLIVQAFGLDISLLACILIFSLGTIAGALSMIPGGLGVAEGSLAGLLIYFGATASVAMTISIVIRLVTLWFGVLIGIGVFLFNRNLFLQRK